MVAKHALALAFVALLPACGDSGASARERGAQVSTSASNTAPAPSAPAKPVPPARRARSSDPDVVALRAALDFGRLDEVRAQLAAAERAPDETAELRARASALEGRTLDALRQLEEARRAAPKDAALFAAIAEVYGTADKFETAWSELKRGDETCGPSAELLRARGVLWILKEGGAKKGLELLEKALAADPELAFAARPLGQAHLLCAKLAAKENDEPLARRHVERSLAFDPHDVDARRLRADLCAAEGDFTNALATLEELVKQGEPLAQELATMHKRGGIAALILHDRPLALTRFQRARALGLSDDELASGAEILADEARVRTERGAAAYSKGELDAAEADFRAALELDPSAIAAKNHLAVVAFRRESFTEAAALWRDVLAQAEREKLELPEPVHLNLAKALQRAGERENARSIARAYVDAHPDGRWCGATKAWLAETDESASNAPR